MKKIAIIGAGIFGVVTALKLSDHFEVTLFDSNFDIMLGASYINQARVHRGYHYPRSDQTTKQCIQNYKRFEEYFNKSIIKDFQHYYCIAKNNSKTTPLEYLDFLERHKLKFKIVELDESIIKLEKVSLTVLVEEYAFDGESIRESLKTNLSVSEIDMKLNCKVVGSIFDNGKFNINYIDLLSNLVYNATFDYVVNSTYSNINGIIDMFGLDRINVNHHLTEMVIVDAKQFKSIGITIMDGDFMSIMPFNFQGHSSISNVLLTPHEIANNILPSFVCNRSNLVRCSSRNLDYCNTCLLKPKTKFLEMLDFADNYIGFADKIEFVDSLITVKTIVDNKSDGRPSLIYIDRNNHFITILAGKIDTVFEIADEISSHFINFN